MAARCTKREAADRFLSPPPEPPDPVGFHAVANCSDHHRHTQVQESRLRSDPGHPLASSAERHPSLTSSQLVQDVWSSVLSTLRYSQKGLSRTQAAFPTAADSALYYLGTVA